ncbi:hypothetical protein DL765_009223 [Monosporascus sp. GIB2]|nr:hypothetical protein DL765_009223 [Monosporascus sp. GIB2]
MATNSYDFIIIGGGTASLVLANHSPRIAVSKYLSLKQLALHNKKINIPHGRTLGGSSAINGQAFIATSKAGIDTWGEFGNLGWSWEALAPYFKKAHTLALPSKDTALYNHFHLDYIDTNISAWIETLHALGHKATGDPFSGEIIGAYTNAASIDPQIRQRSYAASAHLKPAQDRSNLTVLTGAHVQRILLRGNPPEVVAVGAVYVHGQETKTASAREEVILSAGTLHSPKILELTGVGNPDLLSSLNIPVVVANKYVGENLQDHPMSGLSFEVKGGVKTIDDLLRRDPVVSERAMEQYAQSQSAQTAYYNRLLKIPKESTASFFTYAAQGNLGSASGSFLMQSTLLPGNYYSVAVCLLQPLSRGCVHIRIADPSGAVKVDPRYLTQPLDLEVFARHMTYIHTIISMKPLASLLKPNGRRNAYAPTDLTDLDAMRKYVQ